MSCQPKHPAKKTSGRHRVTTKARGGASRAAFAALVTATVIGTGLTAAGASADGGDSDYASAAVDSARDLTGQSSRDDARDLPPTPETPAPTTPAPGQSPGTASAEPNTKTDSGRRTPQPEWVLPSKAEITDVYGPRAWRGGEMHNGTDFGAWTGDEIYAASDGTVVQAGWNGGYGYSVTIEHEDGVTTLYGHNSEVLVGVGDEVKAGDVVSLAGATGDVTGPHLHFEVMVDGEYVDPQDFLRDKGLDI